MLWTALRQALHNRPLAQSLPFHQHIQALWCWCVSGDEPGSELGAGLTSRCERASTCKEPSTPTSIVPPPPGLISCSATRSSCVTMSAAEGRTEGFVCQHRVISFTRPAGVAFGICGRIPLITEVMILTDCTPSYGIRRVVSSQRQTPSE
jgi:hypothetical protein